MGTSTLVKCAAAGLILTICGTTGWQLHGSAQQPGEGEPRDPTAVPPRGDHAGAVALDPAAADDSPPDDSVGDSPTADESAVPAAGEVPERGAPSSEVEHRAELPGDPEPRPGDYFSPQVVVDGHTRVYPLTRNVWVRPTPSSARSWIGFLWFGNSVRVRDASPRSGRGCRGQWYPVEPRGYVCVDDRRATIDPHHPLVSALTAVSPQLASAWPHRYGESIGLVRYAELPSVRRQRAAEWYYRKHQARVSRARAGEPVPSLLGIDLTLPPQRDILLPELPPTLPMPHTRLKPRSTVAWSWETLHEERAFLLAADLKWVPKDRVKPYPTVTFRGVRIGQEARLPLAFFRARARPEYVRTPSGAFEPSGRSFERLSWVELTGRSEAFEGEEYLETRDPGRYVRRADAVVPELARQTPWGTPLGANVDERAPKRGRQTWIEVSILGGWMLAYEGHRPVFATLVSAGRGGPPQGDIDPVETASTPTGRFKITGKFATATMIAPNELTHSDVPWAQNFSGPHALHAAYWHDAWGELKSGGCLNVSPLDGRWLFHHFTEPALPEGWHGVRWLPKLEPATTLIVRR